MHHIAICDDEPVIRKQLRTMLTEHPLAGELVLSEFDSGEVLLESLEVGRRYLLIILDIEMKTVSGVEVGKALRHKLVVHPVSIKTMNSWKNVVYYSKKRYWRMQICHITLLP